MSVSLKVGIQRHIAAIARMMITTMGVTLPNLDPHATDGSATFVEHLAHDVADLALGNPVLTFNHHEIVIGIEWDARRIERTAALRRCHGQPGRIQAR